MIGNAHVSDPRHFRMMSWFDVHVDFGDLVSRRRGKRVVIGFNPPFGPAGEYATRFLEHCGDLRPDAVAVIVPRIAADGCARARASERWLGESTTRFSVRAKC